MRSSTPSTCRRTLLLVMLTLGLAHPASAAVISVGSAGFGLYAPYFPDPARGYVPYIGVTGTISNTSPVQFLDVYIQLDYNSATASATHAWDCSGLTVGSGASSTCQSGPIEYVPGLLWGIGIGGIISGRLASRNFLMPDGNTFHAWSDTFSIAIHDSNSQQDPTWDLTRLIQIEGDIIPAIGPPPQEPQEPPQPVPEPTTLAMLGGGVWMLVRRRVGRRA
jgi:hypothetical protein